MSALSPARPLSPPGVLGISSPAASLGCVVGMLAALALYCGAASPSPLAEAYRARSTRLRGTPVALGITRLGQPPQVIREPNAQAPHAVAHPERPQLAAAARRDETPWVPWLAALGALCAVGAALRGTSSKQVPALLASLKAPTGAALPPPGLPVPPPGLPALWQPVVAALPRGRQRPRWSHPAALAALLAGVTHAAPSLAAVPAPLEVAAAFSAVTMLPQVLWLLMVALPRSPVTRAVLEPWGPVIAVALLHLYIDVLGAQQPGAPEDVRRFGEVFTPGADSLGAFRQMLLNPSFVTEEWSHVLAWDLFVGRWMWQDGLRRGIDARAATLLTDLSGPPGLLLYLLQCVLGGKGLPPPGTEVPLAPPPLPAANVPPLRADDLVRQLFGAPPAGSAISILNHCAEDVVWEDLSTPTPAVGREAVFRRLAARERADVAARGRCVVEQVADGVTASGFTWHRAAEGVAGRGLRGTTFVRLNSAGHIAYVREAAEPLAKPGGATAALLKAIAKPGPTSAHRFESRTPAAGPQVVQYLWNEVQGSPNFRDESLRFFRDDIVYEDFNFPAPFVGKPAVDAFLQEFDIPGLRFVLQETTDGQHSCCFTWEVELNLGPDARRIKGLSFYQFVDGRVAYVRDIPEPALKPPALQALAGWLRPGLRRFQAVP